MYVYKITNMLNDKVYIGITTRTIEERFQEHKYRLNERKHLHLYSSMIKYGVQNFKVEELEKCDSIESLFTKEREWIKKFDSTNPDIGYNNTNGGEGFERIETDDEFIAQLYLETRSYVKIAEMLNLSESTVRRRLQSQNVVLDRGLSTRVPEVIKLYQTPHTIDYICKKLDLSNKTVIKILDENNIERHGLQSFPQANEMLEKFKNGASYTQLGKEYRIGRHRVARIIEYKLKI